MMPVTDFGEVVEAINKNKRILRRIKGLPDKTARWKFRRHPEITVVLTKSDRFSEHVAILEFSCKSNRMLSKSETGTVINAIREIIAAYCRSLPLAEKPRIKSNGMTCNDASGVFSNLFNL